MKTKLTPLNLALSGIMAAIIFIATYALKIPMPLGYIHLGDGFILIAAAALGWPAVFSAAIGSTLADLLAGYSIYMAPTFIIKGAVAAIAVLACTKQTQPAKIIYMLLAEALMVAGYFVTDWLVLGFGWAAAVSVLLGNVLQGLSGVMIWILLMPVLKRIQKQP